MGSRKQNDTVGQGQGRKSLKVGLGGMEGRGGGGHGMREGEEGGGPFGREMY